MNVSESNLYTVQYEDDEMEEYDETEVGPLIVYKEDAPAELWAFVQDAPSRQPEDKVSPPPPPPSLVDDETSPPAETTVTATEAEPEKMESTEPTTGEENPSEEEPKPSTTESTEAEPSEAKPTEGETTETAPAEGDVVEAKPADGEVAPATVPADGEETKPADTAEVAPDTKPADYEVSEESKPADVETTAVEVAQVKPALVAPIFTDPKSKLEQLKLALQAMKKGKPKRQYRKRVYKQKHKNGTKVRKVRR